MYVPPAFAETDLAALHAFIDAHPFALLVTADAAGGAPLATPLPLIVVPHEGDKGTLYGHFAKPNPHGNAVFTAPSRAVFQGPDAYISPGWYPSKRAHGKAVPTWNYSTVDCVGQAEPITEPDAMRALLAQLTAKFETGRAEPWSMADAPEPYIAAMLKGITAFKLPITTITGKRKLSQNRSGEDIDGVIDGLRAEADPKALAVAKDMAQIP
jgi:transcriptional regulator